MVASVVKEERWARRGDEHPRRGLAGARLLEALEQKSLELEAATAELRAPTSA
jgi:hypothetical protein